MTQEKWKEEMKQFIERFDSVVISRIILISIRNKRITKISESGIVKEGRRYGFVVIKTKRQGKEGMDSPLLKGEYTLRRRKKGKSGSSDGGLSCLNGGNDNARYTLIWKIECTISSIDGEDLQGYARAAVCQYKTNKTELNCRGTQTFSPIRESTREVCILIMAQSNLIGSSGEMKTGEGARKRLRITVPHFDNTAVIRAHAKTLIGRCMNPEVQDMPSLLMKLPKIWNLEERVVGTDLGLGKFQFQFQTEEDIEAVLSQQPYHFDYWMVALARWKPQQALNFPSEITFWVRVLGVPTDFRDEPTFESIGNAFGRTVEVDLDLNRIKVVVDGFQELYFETTVDFKGGEFYKDVEAPVSLRFEKLFGYCLTCYSLCHKAERCPLMNNSGTRNTERRTETRETRDGGTGRHDERARSYRGVVLNGSGSNQTKDREGRDYHGKGKGKVTEEADSKWKTVPEKRNKYYRDNYRGEGERSHYRQSRREEQRERNERVSRSLEQAKEVSSRGDSRKEAPENAEEEGEIKSGALDQAQEPSKEFKEALKKTQAEGTEVIWNPMDEEKGLQVVSDIIGENGDAAALREDEVMDMEAIKASLLEHGLDMDAEDFMNDIEEAEERMEDGQEMGEERKLEGKETQGDDEGGNERIQEKKAVAVGRNQGERRRVPRHAACTTASNKLRAAASVLSPRKKNAAKGNTSQGEGAKPLEGKGAANQKAGIQK